MPSYSAGSINRVKVIPLSSALIRFANGDELGLSLLLDGSTWSFDEIRRGAIGSDRVVAFRQSATLIVAPNDREDQLAWRNLLSFQTVTECEFIGEATDGQIGGGAYLIAVPMTGDDRPTLVKWSCAVTDSLGGDFPQLVITLQGITSVDSGTLNIYTHISGF